MTRLSISKCLHVMVKLKKKENRSRMSWLRARRKMGEPMSKFCICDAKKRVFFSEYLLAIKNGYIWRIPNSKIVAYTWWNISIQWHVQISSKRRQYPVFTGTGKESCTTSSRTRRQLASLPTTTIWFEPCNARTTARMRHGTQTSDIAARQRSMLSQFHRSEHHEDVEIVYYITRHIRQI